MTMTTTQVHRLEEALRYVSEHPEEHDQNQWFCLATERWEALPWPAAQLVSVPWSCGSSGCLAGVLVAQAGGRFIVGRSQYAHTAELDGRRDEVSDLAADLIGLADDEREPESGLFGPDWDLPDLYAMAYCLSDMRIPYPYADLHERLDVLRLRHSDIVAAYYLNRIVAAYYLNRGA